MSVKDYKELEVYRLAFGAAMETFEINKTFRQDALSCCRSFHSDAPRSTLHALRVSGAFTLIELIVVVAVIALLIALLIPNIRSVREKAWSANCQNNLKQYGMALNQYLISYESGSAAGGSAYAETYGITANSNMIIPGSPGEMVTAGGGTLPSDRYFSGGTGDDEEERRRGGSSRRESYLYSILDNLPSDVTMKSLSEGKASVRICPVVLRYIQEDGNFFDEDSPNYKGDHQMPNDPFVYADFQGSLTIITNLLLSELEGITNPPMLEGEVILSAFTTYAPNPSMSTGTPQNAIAFIDWNAREGWNATLNYTNWQFTTPPGQDPLPPYGSVVQGMPKWTNAWWLTEVGFYHPLDGEYGANYVAMDGHVGWISSNDITQASFTTGVGP